MGYFYFDESIQGKGGFIIGAFVYSSVDKTPEVDSAIKSVGLRPLVDEFKSGCRMDRNPEQVILRKELVGLLMKASVGVIVIPESERELLGREAILGLQKILRANDLLQKAHQIFFDEGITVDYDTQKAFSQGDGSSCELQLSQDSKLVGGIQLADLAAHSLGIMLMEELGLISKKIRVGEGSGYHPDTDIEIGFELWTLLRYQFFKALRPTLSGHPDDPVTNMNFDVANYGLYISEKCNVSLREAALNRFGSCYLGCIY